MLFGDAPEGLDNLRAGAPSATAPAALIYARDMRAFESLGGYQQTGFELSGPSDPVQVNASRLQAKHVFLPVLRRLLT